MMINNKSKKLTIEEIDVVCIALASNDLATAWIFLKDVNEDDPVGLYNNALCQWMAGKYIDALTTAIMAYDKFQIPVGTSLWTADSTMLEIIENMKMPKPLTTVTADVNPTFAKIYASWLLALCYHDCGKNEEAQQIIIRLNKYKIKLPVK